MHIDTALGCIMNTSKVQNASATDVQPQYSLLTVACDAMQIQAPLG